MAHQVFISHSAKDKQIADAVCHHLEAKECPCWIAPRDITPGDSWPAAISKAISKSRVMILVFSSNSNASEQVTRELTLAAKNKIIIVPFRIEQNLEPEPGKDFFLDNMHWLDAMNPPTQEQIEMLVYQVVNILNPPPPPPPPVVSPPGPRPQIDLSSQAGYTPPPPPSDMYQNIPYTEWSRYGMTPSVIGQAELDGREVRQIEVSKKMLMTCPYCGTRQQARAGVPCSNSSCGAYLWVSTVMKEYDPLGEKVVTYAFGKKESARPVQTASDTGSSGLVYKVTPGVKENLKKFFAYLVWSGTVDQPALSAFYSILQLEKGMDHRKVVATLESWVAEAKVQAAQAMNMRVEEMGFLNVNLAQPLTPFPIIEDAFFMLYKLANKSNPTSAASNIAATRLALTEIVGEKRQKELVGIWNTRLH